MKGKVLLITLGLFLMVFMIGGIYAEIEDISNSAIKEYSVNNINKNNFNDNCIDGKDKTEIHYYWLGFNEYNKLDIEGKYELMNISGTTNWFSNCNQNTKFKLIFDPQFSHRLEFTEYKSDLIYPNDVKMEYGDESYWGSVHGYSDYWFDNSTNMDFYRIFLYFDLNGYNKTGNTYDFISYPNANSITGYMKIHLLMKNGVIQTGSVEDNLIVKRTSNYEQRVSALELWQQTINNTLTSIQNSITLIFNTLTNHETRISTLENQTPSIFNGTLPNYFKYLSPTDRKNIVCGYAEDNHLTQLIDLGWNCAITYRQTLRGETSSCRCRKL